MDYIHNARISVFAKQDEDAERIKQGLIGLTGINITDEKIRLHEQTASGFNDSRIRIFEVFLEKKKHTKVFLKHLLGLLSDEQKEILSKQAYSRLDEELFFFMRFDKEKWLGNQSIWITDQGNCYHIKLSIASYPKSYDNAIKTVKEMLSQHLTFQNL